MKKTDIINVNIRADEALLLIHLANCWSGSFDKFKEAYNQNWYYKNIIKPTNYYDKLGDFFWKDMINDVKFEDDKKEMTVWQIETALWYKIKIVK